MNLDVHKSILLTTTKGHFLMAALTLKDLQAQIDELKAMVVAQNEVIEELKSQGTGGRDRGPKSEGEMTEEHAIRVMLGDLRDQSHKDAALELKLSYGQIYSARKGYTFKKIYQRMIKGEVIETQELPEMIAEVQQIAADIAQQLEDEA